MSAIYKFCAAYSNVRLAAPSLTETLYLMNNNFYSFLYSFIAGFSNNSKVLRMKEERADLEIGLQEETVKTRRKKNSFSKIFNRLLECLEMKLHPHMLYYTNDKEDEFEVILKHARNKGWAPECIRLFRDLDKINGHNDKDPNYSGAARGRFRSNMGKLCQGKYVEKIDNDKDKKPGKGQTVLKYKILTKGKEPIRPAVKVVNRRRIKYGGGAMTDEKEKEIISETLDGPPPNKRTRTASPLVLPGISNIQDTGANPLNGLNPYVFPVLITFQNIGADTMNGLYPHVPYDINSNEDTGANTTLNGCNNTLNGSNLHVPYDINSNPDIGANTTLNGCNNTLNGSNLHVPYDINSNEDTGANTTLNGCNNTLNGSDHYDLGISEEFVKRIKICEIVEDLKNYELNDEDTFYDNEYKEMLVSPLLSSTADREQDLESVFNLDSFGCIDDFDMFSDFSRDFQCYSTAADVCNV